MSAEFTFDKDNWRKRNVAWIKKAHELFAGNKLKCSYLELMGESGIASFKLMRSLFKTADQFVALEQEPRVFMVNCLNDQRDHHGYKLIYGDAYQIAPQIAVEYKPPVAVFNFDGMKSVGNDTWWRQNGPLMRSTINKSIATSGVCVVMLNQTLDKPKELPADRVTRLRVNTLKMSEFFSSWGVKVERILGRGDTLAKSVMDNSFKGQLGAYEIYKSTIDDKDRVLRMATTRFIFRKNGCLIECEPMR